MRDVAVEQARSTRPPSSHPSESTIMPLTVVWEVAFKRFDQKPPSSFLTWHLDESCQIWDDHDILDLSFRVCARKSCISDQIAAVAGLLAGFEIAKAWSLDLDERSPVTEYQCLGRPTAIISHHLTWWSYSKLLLLERKGWHRMCKMSCTRALCGVVQGSRKGTQQRRWSYCLRQQGKESHIRRDVRAKRWVGTREKKTLNGLLMWCSRSVLSSTKQHWAPTASCRTEPHHRPPQSKRNLQDSHLVYKCCIGQCLACPIHSPSSNTLCQRPECRYHVQRSSLTRARNAQHGIPLRCSNGSFTQLRQWAQRKLRHRPPCNQSRWLPSCVVRQRELLHKVHNKNSTYYPLRHPATLGDAPSQNSRSAESKNAPLHKSTPQAQCPTLSNSPKTMHCHDPPPESIYWLEQRRWLGFARFGAKIAKRNWQCGRTMFFRSPQCLLHQKLTFDNRIAQSKEHIRVSPMHRQPTHFKRSHGSKTSSSDALVLKTKNKKQNTCGVMLNPNLTAHGTRVHTHARTGTRTNTHASSPQSRPHTRVYLCPSWLQ